MKRWEKAVNNKWASGATHTFLLHLNVSDLFWDEEDKQFESLTEHLISSTILRDACFTAIYNRADGICFPSPVEEDLFIKFLTKLHSQVDSQGKNIAEMKFRVDRYKLSYALTLMSEMLQISPQTSNKEVRKAMMDAGLGDYIAEMKSPFFAVILEYAETICPVDSATTCHDADRNAVVTLQVWAKNAKIEKAQNVIFLLSAGLNLVAPELRSETNGVVPLKIEFPDIGDRMETIRYWRGEFKPKEKDLDVLQFANLTAGMSRRAIRNVIKEAHLKGIAITPERIFDQKKKFIESQSGGLLEILQPLWGVEAIGGLEAHKKYIHEIVGAMQEGNLLAVPMGVLLLGAPGTGKTVFAEAVAHEAKIPFVKMKNIREKWVGQSERNLDLALELIRALSPVVVFVDEIDQQYQSRNTGFDNTGVNQRIQGELFQFMSDTNFRGRVLWVAASNRPDLLDPAMLREGRFDEKIPFFPPEPKERGEILLAIFKKMEAQARAQSAEFRYEISADFHVKFGAMSHWHTSNQGLRKCDPETDMHKPNEEEEAGTLSLTGAQIEKIVNDAYKFAAIEKTVMRDAHILAALSNYLPHPDFLQSSKMTDQAIMHCTSERFIPVGKWRERAGILRQQSTGESAKSSNVIFG